MVFSNSVELKEQLGEHLDDFHAYHGHGANEDSPFREADRRKADTALRFFCTIWGQRLQQQDILDKDRGAFLCDTLSRAVNLVKKRKPAIHDDHYCLNLEHHEFSELRKDLTKFVIQKEVDDMTWLLIKHVDVFLDHPLLRFITLINLPGTYPRDTLRWQ